MEVNNKTVPVTGQQDQNTISLDLMNRMKLHGMAEAFRESLAGTTPQSMTADTFLSMLLAREWDYRSQAAIARLTKNAAFRYKAYIEQIDYATNRGLDRNQMERLATLDFVHKAQNLFITGSSGTGKSYLACALGHEACKRGFRTLYANAPKLLGALKVAKVNIDENQATPAKYGIRGIPTLMIFKNGNIEATKVGALSKSQLAAFIDSNL